jgi:zinc finger SWIM domain-containing protein 3
MSGKQPTTILTDQSATMAKAINEVFPKSNHRLCVWHIYQNAAKHLSHVFHSSKQFADDFGNCVYDYEDEDEWLLSWDNMLKKYNLTNNKWLEGIFDIKEKWAMVYGRHMFTADMKTTQRSESMNNVLKKYLKSKYNLLRFLEHYSRLLADKRHQELQAEFKMSQTTPILRVDVEMLRHAVKLYTPEVFQIFQDEYMKMGDCTIYKASKSDTITEYKVKYRQRPQEHLVKFEASTTIVQCSCMKLNFVGIPCVHALKVLDKKNIKKLPINYILKRWTNDGKVGTIKDYRGIDIKANSQESIGKRYSHLSHNFREISTLAAESVTMYECANRCSKKLLKYLQEMRTKCYSDGVECQLEVQGEGGSSSDEDVALQAVLGIKTKSSVGRPKRRLKGALERRKNVKSQNKIAYASSCVSNLHQAVRGTRQIQSLEYLSKVRYFTLFYITFL